MRATRSDPAAGVQNPALDAALISGSDARLAIDPASGLNPYGCQPWPRADEISLSSSTASTVSPRGYAAARMAFERLERAAGRGHAVPAFAEMADEMRGALRDAFDLPDTEVILSPSGTDGALQALFLARGLLGKAVVSIVVAADETGNGVAAAASGRHFAATASGGAVVAKNEMIAGLGSVTVSIPARDVDGQPRPLAEIDAEVERAATSARREGYGVLLHVMDHSKLGGRGPSYACVDAMCARHRHAIRVVVDACQGRLARAQLRRYLARGFLVLITGSKFFTGPPLSGALLVPGGLRAAIGRIADVPAGLADYTARDDWPACFGLIRRQLPMRVNVGQMLRWVAAVEEIRAYWAVPDLFRRLALGEFAAAVPRHIARFPELELLSAPPARSGDDEKGEFASRSIFAFTVRCDGRALSLAQARVLHRALNGDPGGGGPGHRAEVPATPCHIGQPVAVADGAGGTTGALRISADARLVSESWVGTCDLASTGRLTQRIDRIAMVLETLCVLSAQLHQRAGVGVA